MKNYCRCFLNYKHFIYKNNLNVVTLFQDNYLPTRHYKLIQTQCQEWINSIRVAGQLGPIDAHILQVLPLLVTLLN